MLTGQPRRRRLWVYALAALALHALLFVAVKTRQRAEAPESPLAGKFEKRRPLRQQVLNRRMALPRQSRSLRRELAAPRAFARATANAAKAPSSPGVLLGQRPSVALPRRAFTPGYGAPTTGRLHSRAVAVEVVAQEHVDLGLELLDVDALDTGRYRALVVQDPSDRRHLRGFVHVAAVGIRSALQAALDNGLYQSVRPGMRLESGGLEIPDWRHRTDVRAMDELAVVMSARTQVHMTVDRDLYLSDDGWLDTPFVLLTSATEFVAEAAEVENLGRYLTGGGFAYVEVVGHGDSRADFYGGESDLHSLRGLVEAALESQDLRRGVDWEVEPLPPSHPVFPLTLQKTGFEMCGCVQAAFCRAPRKSNKSCLTVGLGLMVRVS